MEPPRRRFLQLAASAVVIPAAAPLAEAQGWPNRVVRVVVGLPAGGGADAVARILANRLSEIWGQQVIVENRSGAGGTLAYDAVAHAPADGYTILLATRAPELNQLLFSSISHGAADFAPVTVIGKFPYLLVVPASLPVKSLPEFISHAAANPGKVTFASTGVGTLPHLAGELLKRTAGIEMTHVPYRGVAAGAMNDLIAGRIDAMFNALASLLPPVRAGQVRALAVTTAERFPTVHELPTFAECGVRSFDVAAWYALYVPARTAPEIIKKINADTVTALMEPAVRAKFEPLGTALIGSTPDQLADTARADVERFGPIIKALNISGE
jgi:tripartite-type tricarboxylate transporter receptor subunit TctC